MRIYFRIIVILSVVLLNSCEFYSCYYNLYADITDYKVEPNMVTNAGFQVDTEEIDYPGDKYFWEMFDSRLMAMEECMLKIDPSLGEIKRECFVVKFIKQTYFSKCSPDEQFIPVKAPNELCEAKGLEPTEECPCVWRTAIQSNNYIIVPYSPDATDLNLWDLVRLHTGINNFWITEYAKCGNL